MSPVYWVVLGVVTAFALSAVGALVWAIGQGQMEHFSAGARSIFDAGEPVGTPTDAFPGTARRGEG
ncbi:MAG TPA: hypothetical protein PLS53_15265 [Thermoanaerobaculaceae bacterium]|nr:hypothetical protein [Thermoanaerobaculaceae bacterium]HPS79518.1 hypothetical protein [Thermoanaerobaculaceae bacterium]